MAATDASAMELDDLLPTRAPGFGVSDGLSVLDRPHPGYAALPVQLGGVTLQPSVAAGLGYDSAPNGAATGSPLVELDPSLVAFNPLLGLGAYVSGAYTNYPDAAGQDLAGYTVALGEHALLPRETIDVTAAAIGTQETAFGLTTVAVTKPIAVSVQDFRGSDSIICGMLTLKPELSATDYYFSGDGGQNRSEYRQGLTSEFTPGGPARLVLYLHATEAVYPAAALNANTYSALTGVAREASGLWNIRLLLGISTRHAAFGASSTAPVLEASMEWMPSDLDSVKLDLAREMDDPEQESAEGYTLTKAQFSLAHEYLRNVILTGSLGYSHAAYFNSALIESLYGVTAAIDWHLNRNLAVNAGYAFNDRQANFLQAANQHIFTLGITWSP